MCMEASRFVMPRIVPEFPAAYSYCSAGQFALP
jgi:hypothetical protein